MRRIIDGLAHLSTSQRYILVLACFAELLVYSSLGTAINQLTKLLPGSYAQQEYLTGVLVSSCGTFIGIGCVIGAVLQKYIGVYSRVIAQILLITGFTIVAIDVPGQLSGPTVNATLHLDDFEERIEFTELTDSQLRFYTLNYMIAFSCITQGGASILIFNISTIPELFKSAKATANYILHGTANISNAVYLLLRLTTLPLDDAFKLLAMSAIFLPIPATIIFFNVSGTTGKTAGDNGPGNNGPLECFKQLFKQPKETHANLRLYDSLRQDHFIRVATLDRRQNSSAAPQKQLSTFHKHLILSTCYIFLVAISLNLILFYYKFEDTLGFQSSSIDKSTIRSTFAVMQSAQIVCSISLGLAYDGIRKVLPDKLYLATAAMALVGIVIIAFLRVSLLYPSTAIYSFFLCILLNAYTWGFMSGFVHLLYEGCSSVGIVMSVMNTSYSVVSIYMMCRSVTLPEPVVWIMSGCSLLFPIVLILVQVKYKFQ